MKPGELLVPADECARKPADTSRPHERERSHDLAADHARGLSLRLDRGRLCELEGTARGGDGALSGEDLAGGGGLLESRCNVDGVAADERAVRSRAADDDLSGVDADPQGELDAEGAR